MFKIIVLLFPVVASLYWALHLIFNFYERNNVKQFLGVFMAHAVILYVSHNIYYHKLWEVYRYINSFYTFASLANFPMFYIYIRLLTKDESFSVSKHIRYLILPIVFAISLGVMDILMSKEEWMYYFQSVLLKGDEPNSVQRITFYIYSLARLTFIVQVVFYYIKSRKLVNEHNVKMLDYYSDTETRGLKWLSNFNVLLFFAALVGIWIAVAGRESYMDNMEALFLPSFSVACGIFVLGYLGSKQKSVFIKSNEIKVENWNKNVDVLTVQRKLLRLFEEDKIYLKHNLKLWEVADRLNVDRNVVSQLLIERFEQNFSSFVNYYRIEHAKNKLKQNQYATTDELAKCSGFASVNAFNKTFYQKEGMSLTDYKKLMN